MMQNFQDFKKISDHFGTLTRHMKLSNNFYHKHLINAQFTSCLRGVINFS